ncbi:oligopeptide/dipeptide ABC transporter ATP-binding protein [Streptosporangium minutum]|uniref:oligopeptide/dipeptide ABC transporter ATP-binding protein n=1 Tax=Streptosporangium minutum TaxID=569862 RepID=UPI0026BCCFEC
MIPPRAGSRSGWFVESGPVEEVLKASKHPYTQALLSVLPESPERVVLTGGPPDPTRIPGGCRFHARCQVPASGKAASEGADGGCRPELLQVLPAVPEAQAVCYFAERSVPTSA